VPVALLHCPAHDNQTPLAVVVLIETTWAWVKPVKVGGEVNWIWEGEQKASQRVLNRFVKQLPEKVLPSEAVSDPTRTSVVELQQEGLPLKLMQEFKLDVFTVAPVRGHNCAAAMATSNANTKNFIIILATGK